MFSSPFTASPLSIQRKFSCSEGAIVGWSFEQEVSIEAGMLNMKKAIRSPIPDICRAGQWMVSCIMTARMAADLVHACTTGEMHKREFGQQSSEKSRRLICIINTTIMLVIADLWS